MALHDIAKDDKRIQTPLPYTGDKRAQRMAQGVEQISPKQENAETGRVAFKPATIIGYDDENVADILLGYQHDGFGVGKHRGFKFAQEGIDVLTATDDQLIMSSAFNNFKIVDIIYTDYTTPDNTAGTTYGTDTVAIVHGKTYPITLTFFGSTYVTTTQPTPTDPLPFLEERLMTIGLDRLATIGWKITPVGTLSDRVILSVLYPPGGAARRFYFKTYVLKETTN